MIITYISILRGINVSGYRMIRMDALRQLIEDLGFNNIQTYIQSGNVVFQTNKAKSQDLEKKIADKITESFGFNVPVIVKEYLEIKQIVTDNPFLKDKTKDVSHLHITFLSARPEQEKSDKLNEGAFQPDEFRLTDKVIYLYCPKGYSNSKLTNSFLESKLKVTATTRNWKTVNALINVAEKMAINIAGTKL
jgi:uncharacterized protein (DUF1697 family)